ncbi:MAG TPA: NUDIX domain-containing protein [Candidatus Limnocylindrales bacterium]|nr:NUDIX domain-containing protein [Candidatus Limnocylindrales bacterium]
MSPRPAPDPAPDQAPGTAGGEDRPPAPPLPAATVVLLRPGNHDLQVLLTRRPATMAFGPDIHVFPGGRVDPADATPEALAAAGITPDQAAANLGVGLAPDGGMTAAAALAHHVAAVRETVEETGIVVRAADLIAMTRWVTPISLARRFDVRFFAAFVPSGTEVGGGSDEVAEVVWMSPARALEAAAAGRMELWQPTIVTLQQLDGLASADAVRAAFAAGTMPGGPVIERRSPGLARVDAPWAGGIPGRRAAGWLLGSRDVVVVDPADPTGVTTDAIRAAVAAAGGRLAGVVVTALVPERHAGVEMFAHGLGLPVAVAGAVAGAPYPAMSLGADDPLPFGDSGLRLRDVLRLA